MEVVPFVVIVAQSRPRKEGDVPIVTRIEPAVARGIDILDVFLCQANAEQREIDQAICHTTAGALTIERRVSNQPHLIRRGIEELDADVRKYFGISAMNHLILPPILVTRILS